MNGPSDDEPFVNFLTPLNHEFYQARPYRELNAGHDEFRFLEVLPGDGMDPIRCNMIEPPRSSDLRYECISYRAGDPNDTLPVEVNGHLFNTFETLDTALRRIRLPDCSRIVWADQICINQNDVAERSSQVQKMRSIYEKADGVLAWLGHLNDSDIAVAELGALQSEFDSAWDDFRKQNPTKTVQSSFVELQAIAYEIAALVATRLEQASRPGNEADLARWSALGGLFRSELWWRVWIFQELVVAKTVTLLWDAISLNLMALDIPSKILCILISLEDVNGQNNKPRCEGMNRLLGKYPDKARLTSNNVQKILNFRKDWKDHGKLDLRSVLEVGRWLNCTDDRDRIYGFCALMPKDCGIVPDYSKTPQLIFCETAVALMKIERNMDVLAECLHPRVEGTAKGVPSWCPNWSAKRNYTNRRMPLVHSTLWPPGSRFQASKTLSGRFKVMQGTWRNGLYDFISLQVDGLIIGPVLLGEHPDVTLQDKPGAYESLLNSWSKLVAEHRDVTPEVLEELEKTATVDDAGHLHVPKPRVDDAAVNYVRLKLDVLEGNRRFVVLANGTMGMAPRHVKEGDLAYVLVSSTVPYVLRNNDGIFTLVGELYLSDGFMFGKAVDMMESGLLERETLELR